MKDNSSLKYLGASFLCISIFFCYRIFLYEAKLFFEFPHLLMVTSPIMLLMAPLFYLGIRGLTKNKVGLTKKDLIHFLPAILHVLELLPIYLKSSAEKIELLQHIFKYENELIVSVHGLVPNIWIDLIRFTLMIYYFAKSWRMIFRSDLVNKYLKSDRISSWFKASLIYFAIFQIIIPFQ